MIVYYITAHGFGHAVRSCEVIRNLPADLPLTIRSEVPEWLLRSELGGWDFALAPARFDCGTIGPDATRVDLAATIDAAEPILAANDARLDDEVAFLRRVGARVVVADSAAFPLRAARAAGVSSILVANFTWAAIYEGLVAIERPGAALAERARRVIERFQVDYDQGDLALVPGLAVSMRACRARHDVPLIARRGRSRRAELAAALGLDPARPIILFYMGVEGREGMRWDRLGGLACADGAPPQLVAYRAPEGAGDFIHVIPQEIGHSDAVASVDAAIAKPGYSTIAECMGGGVPILFTARPQFCEAQAIERDLMAWGGARAIPTEDFLSLHWNPYLARLLELRAAARPAPADGGAQVAAEIEKRWRQAQALQ
jgi:hypothetical protein